MSSGKCIYFVLWVHLDKILMYPILNLTMATEWVEAFELRIFSSEARIHGHHIQSLKYLNSYHMQQTLNIDPTS